MPGGEDYGASVRDSYPGSEPQGHLSDPMTTFVEAGSATSTPTSPASRVTVPYSADPDYLKRCGIDPGKFIPWREHAQAAGLDNDFNVLVPLYVRAQEKRSPSFNFGENPVQDMITLGATKEAANNVAHIRLDLYGHRTPTAWAEMLMLELFWGTE